MLLYNSSAIDDLQACRALLRSGSRSFDSAAKLLPTSVRDPAIALYAFCREADDAVDAGTGNLQEVQQRLSLAYKGHPRAHPVDRAFARVVEAFDMPRILPEALLEGFAWDADSRRYADLSDLRAYAVRVAGTVGAMMSILMGVRERDCLAAAIELGVAMQLSNIARDVGEDARNGRLYLPEDWLLQEGLEPDAFLSCPKHSASLARVVARLLDAADQHYHRATPGITRLPAKCRLGIGAARFLYAEIGSEIRRRGLDPVSGRAVVHGARKALALSRGLPSVLVALKPLSGACLAEGVYLMEAVAQAAPQMSLATTTCRWWDLVGRMRWTIDLFERLEQRERV